MRLEGASPKARFEQLDASPDSTSYFIGADPKRWTRDVPHYRRLAWRGVYPGVDLVFYGHEGRLEYDFIVAPGVDPASIQLIFDPLSKLSLTAEGDLAIGRPSGLRMRKPVLYQRLADGAQHPVGGSYQFGPQRQVQFNIGKYDHRRALVIDPVITFSSYYGGEKDNSVVAVTGMGDIVGVTSSLAFGNTAPRLGKDIFAVLQGTQFGTLIYVFGGSGDDVATSAVTDLITKGGFGGTDGFLIEVDRRSQFANPQITRVGGSGDDRINALWGTGTTYFAGETTSPDLTLNGQPLKIARAGRGRMVRWRGGRGRRSVPQPRRNHFCQPHQHRIQRVAFPRIHAERVLTQLAGGSDALYGRAFTFAGGAAVSYLAYFGGSGDDAAYGIVSDGGRIVIAGKTTSADLPTKDALSAQLSGPSDAFVVRFAIASTLEFSTYFGGSGSDEIRGLATPSTWTIYFAGTTSSADLLLVKPAQSQYGGGDSDAFAGLLNLDTRTVIFNTYFGGSGRDEGAAISLPSGMYYGVLTEPVVVGSTTSPDLPVVNPPQGQLSGPQDAFVVSFDNSGVVLFLSYFGGSGSVRGLALSVSGDDRHHRRRDGLRRSSDAGKQCRKCSIGHAGRIRCFPLG
jgi:hypothetical protein